jgi:uncharacterized protein (TIGR03435 family)
MTKTQTIVWATVSVVLVVAVIAVKMVFFPSISDKYFTVNSNRLKTVPPGYVVIRPTHFKGSTSGSSRLNRMAYADKGGLRIVGVNVTLQMLIAVAYQQIPEHIVLPPNAPTNHNYDILVTAPGNMRQHLQSAIRRKLGLVGDIETNEVPVMALKIENPTVQRQAFKLSPADEKQNEDMKNGKLYFTHMPLTPILSGIEMIAGSPVVDETGLTNSYDFSLGWNSQLEQQLQGGNFDKDTGNKILEDWGLGLEPDTAPIEMLVVKKVY